MKEAVSNSQKIIFLTGGHGEIGSAVKKKFEVHGYKVVAPSKEELDLSSKENIDKYFDSHKFTVDAFVHCAGVNNPKTILEIPIKDFEQVMMINTLSMISIVKHLFEGLKEKKGHILGVASLYAIISRAGRASYSASKHAMLGLVKTMALEFGQYDIKVNAVSPGFVDTAMTRKNNTQDKINEMISGIPLQKLASADDIASVVYYLCSKDNTYITGQNIIVDGGYLVGGYQK